MSHGRESQSDARWDRHCFRSQCASKVADAQVRNRDLPRVPLGRSVSEMSGVVKVLVTV
jgi:hypothetical protein